MNQKPLVYIASPYTRGVRLFNIQFQHQMFSSMMDEDVVDPVSPLWSNLTYMTDPRFYQHVIEHGQRMIYRCDAVIRLSASIPVQDYLVSLCPMVDNEVEYARKLKKPVFFDVEKLYEWARNIYVSPADNPYVCRGGDACLRFTMMHKE